MAKTKTNKKNKNIRFPKSTDCFVALFTEEGEEVKGKGYCRQPIKNWQFDNINKCFVNSNKISFPTPKQDWGILTCFKICNRIRGGRILRSSHLYKKRLVEIGDSPCFKIGDLDIHWS